MFNRRYTEMVADFHLKTRSIVSYVSAAEFPFNQTAAKSYPRSLGLTAGLHPSNEQVEQAVGQFRGRDLQRTE